MTTKYQFTDDMNEISGFGGGYEEACRAMLMAALEWLDANPEADPQFHGYKNIYGVISEDNNDATTLSQVIMDASEGDCTRAMHQAVVSAALWIRAHGWDAYVQKKTHPGGRAGILQDELERKKEDYERLSKRFDELQAECDRRGVIIARRILGWSKHKASNGVQELYAASPEAAREMGFGKLTGLVDAAIARIPDDAKSPPMHP